MSPRDGGSETCHRTPSRSRRAATGHAAVPGTSGYPHRVGRDQAPSVQEAIDAGLPILVRRLREQRKFLAVRALTATIGTTTGEILLTAAADGTVVCALGEGILDLTHLAVGEEEARRLAEAALGR